MATKKSTKKSTSATSTAKKTTRKTATKAAAKAVSAKGTKSAAKKTSKATGKKTTKKTTKSASKRELIAPNNDKRFVRREKGKFSESDDVSKSLRHDVKKAAKKKVPAGQGDKGDRKRTSK